MRILIKLAIVGLVVHAAFRAGISYMTYYQFRDELRQIAQFSGGRSAEELHERAFEIAQQLDIPITSEQIAVRKERDHTFIDASYEEPIDILPTYQYPWEYQINVDAWTLNLRQAGGPGQ